MKSQPNVLKNPKSMFIVLGVIIVVGLLSIILLVNKRRFSMRAYQRRRL